MDERPIDPPEDAIPRMIRQRGSRGQRWGRPTFTRITRDVPRASELPAVIRTAIDAIEPLDLGEVVLWPVSALTTDGPIERVLLELWWPADPQDHPTRGLTPMLDARSLLEVSPSPDAAPRWVSKAAWELPSVHDLTQVLFTTQDGGRWVDVWQDFPVHLRTPEGISWDDVVDVALYNVDGRLLDAEPGFLQPVPCGPTVHCPFTVPEDDPLWQHQWPDADPGDPVDR